MDDPLIVGAMAGGLGELSCLVGKYGVARVISGNKHVAFCFNCRKNSILVMLLGCHPWERQPIVPAGGLGPILEMA